MKIGGRHGDRKVAGRRGDEKVPKVARLIATSNSYARELLHRVRAWMREHGPWSSRLTEQGRARGGGLAGVFEGLAR